MPIYPIGFSIPAEKIVSSVGAKAKIYSSLVPGVLSSYIYNDEDSYYNEYRQSIFALTCRKAGWDCMRHYEILACGAIPLFVNSSGIPKDTMTFYPKALLDRVYGEIIPTIHELGLEGVAALTKPIADLLLQYTRAKLTTLAMAKYISRVLARPVASILILNIYHTPENARMEYMRDCTIHGFKKMLGAACHEYPRIPHLYTDYSDDIARLYGRGITMTRLLDPSERDEGRDTCVKEDILSHRYDYILYSPIHGDLPFRDEVFAAYRPEEIIMVCGADEHGVCDAVMRYSGNHVFVREIPNGI